MSLWVVRKSRVGGEGGGIWASRKSALERIEGGVCSRVLKQVVPFRYGIWEVLALLTLGFSILLLCHVRA